MMDYKAMWLSLSDKIVEEMENVRTTEYDDNIRFAAIFKIGRLMDEIEETESLRQSAS